MNRLKICMIAATLTLGACERRPDDIPVVVSVIGQSTGNASRNPGSPAAALLGATAQGLVRFDANGRIEPGLAERWTVIEDGKSYIFRLQQTEWANGSAVTAKQVVTALRRAVRRGGQNRLRPFVSAIDEIVEMTPNVIEVRLSKPRPDMLLLFAQPEMAIFESRRLGGTGPFRVQSRDDNGIVLRPAFDPLRLTDSEFEEPHAAEYVRLRAEPAALAIARFGARQSDLVSGGTYRDWPLIEHSKVAPTNRKIDYAYGLFGLSVVSRQGFLATAANREAVAMAIDRGALTAAFLPDWPAAEALLPDQFDSAQPPAQPGWSPFSLEDRRNAARLRVEQWRREQEGEVPVIRIAVPDAPGGNLIWAHVGASLAAIGVRAERVAWRSAADLRLIDRLAPYDSGRWYLVAACQPCAVPVAELILAARDAPDLATRRQRIAEADAALAADIAFIPLARPMRWSLVALRLREWRENPRAVHPLNHLRGDPN
ncbi:ABC transporter substrate-binding protein [Sphingomonas sp. S1-29]|uniref:ABC transporter substrate-binding protein n=1 Tax=Sphingomonas sp. S1-29 TaxID=2991074 RepID=UPI00224099B8|nr:ABC transporter substrate-binding protein [Sphingomonas sp. S1-29]UZK70366.1 ABC transporter substrate-binding protein [Sphingomonas sp. S1-29]